MPRSAFVPAMLICPLLHATCVAQTAAPSFATAVLPVLTRLGCNQGACHGKGAGQNGFRLSLRGYAPEWDHAWITREFAGRPELTRLGCNQGACHGKGAGQNGFRLSLRGYAPEWDHAWITREFAGRR